DLPDRADVPEPNVQRAESGGNALQRRIVRIGQLLGSLGGPRLIQTRERRRVPAGTARTKVRPPDIAAAPPDAGEIRTTVRHARDRVYAASALLGKRRGKRKHGGPACERADEDARLTVHRRAPVVRTS